MEDSKTEDCVEILISDSEKEEISETQSKSKFKYERTPFITIFKFPFIKILDMLKQEDLVKVPSP